MLAEPIDHDRITLAIQQPWAELIVRGLKTIEVRTTGTAVRGTIYLYASKQISAHPAARAAADAQGLTIERLPRGVLVGTADLVDSRPASVEDANSAWVPAELLAGHFGWTFTNPKRLDPPLAPRFLPYGIWFYPFRRRS